MPRPSVDASRELRLTDQSPAARLAELNISDALRECLLVDAEDIPLLMGRRWLLSNKGYATHGWHENGRPCRLQMHRLILSAGPGQQVDHINGNKTDNRRCNLRFANDSQQNMNKDIRRDSQLRVKGVRRVPSGRYVARITPEGGPRRTLGTYATLGEAAVARMAAEKVLHGPYRRILTASA
jgi:hypothetical protein